MLWKKNLVIEADILASASVGVNFYENGTWTFYVEDIDPLYCGKILDFTVGSAHFYYFASKRTRFWMSYIKFQEKSMLHVSIF